MNELQAPQFGTTGGLLARRDGLFAPPAAWPINVALRFAVNEQDVTLAHLVDGRVLEGTVDGVTISYEPNEQPPVVITIDDARYALSDRFRYDIVYGFETAESVRRGLVLFRPRARCHPR